MKAFLIRLYYWIINWFNTVKPFTRKLENNITLYNQKNNPAQPRKKIIVYRENKEVITFYNGEKTWYGTKDTFKEMRTTSVFLPIRKKDEILANAYKEIKIGIEEILTKTNGKINMYESGTYAQTSVKLFHETTLGPGRSESLNQRENEWIKSAVIGPIIWSEQYEGPAEEYDNVCLYPSLLTKKGITWPIGKGESRIITHNDCKEEYPYGIYKATITGNNKAFRFNPTGFYTHFDLELARSLEMEINLLDTGEVNALIYPKSIQVTGRQMFGEWASYLYKIKSEGGPAGKTAKLMLVSLWGALSERQKDINYGDHS